MNGFSSTTDYHDKLQITISVPDTFIKVTANNFLAFW